MEPEIPRNIPSSLFLTCQGHVWPGWGLPFSLLSVTPGWQLCPCWGSCQSHVNHTSITCQSHVNPELIGFTSEPCFDKRWGRSGCQSLEGEGKGRELSWGQDWGIYYWYLLSREVMGPGGRGRAGSCSHRGVGRFGVELLLLQEVQERFWGGFRIKQRTSSEQGGKEGKKKTKQNQGIS